MVETEIGNEFYIDANRLGIFNRKGLIKVKVLHDSEAGKPHNEIDIDNWTLTLQRVDIKSNKKYQIPVYIAEEYGVPISTAEKTYYKPLSGDYVGVLLPGSDEKWPLIRFGDEILQDKEMTMTPRLKNGVFVENIDEETAAIRFYNNPEFSNFFYDLVVPRDNIVNLPTMNSGILMRRLSSFMKLKFSFKKGELVRYRKHGVISVGLIMSKASDRFIIKNSLTNKIEMAEVDQVFKWVKNANSPKTSGNTNEMTELRFHPHLSKDTIQALDAIGKLTSTEEFNSLSMIDQIKMIASFSVGLINYDMKVAKGFNFANKLDLEESIPFGPEQDYPGINFDFCITSGVGVCRHIAPFLAMALRESGFSKVSIVTSESVDTKDVGHAWVEIFLDGVRYVVDPSNQMYVEKYLLGDEVDENKAYFFMRFDSIKKRAGEFDLRHYLREGNLHYRI